MGSCAESIRGYARHTDGGGGKMCGHKSVQSAICGVGVEGSWPIDRF